MNWLARLNVTNWLYICGGLVLTGILLLRIFVDAIVYFFGEPPHE